MTYSYDKAYVSQLHADGSGWADCFQASLGTYLKAVGKLPMDMADADVLNAVSIASRGTPDNPGQGYTTLNEAGIALQHYNIDFTLSYDWTKIIAAPWAILLIDGTAVRLADGGVPYPASFFGGETGPDHFVLSGVAYNGAYNFVANPLALSHGWAQYDLGSLQRATTCGYLLPDVPGKPAPKALHWAAKTACKLKVLPNHTSTGICPIPASASGVTWGETKVVGGETWIKCQFRDVLGWLLRSNLTIAAA